MERKLELAFKDDDDPWDVEQQVFDLVASYVQPDSTQSAHDAAEALDRLVPMHRAAAADPREAEPVSIGGFLWFMWRVVHFIAGQLPPRDAATTAAQDRLAELVHTLRGYTSRTPVLDLGDWGSGYRLWQDLPLWGPTFRETWDLAGAQATSNPETWRGLNAYAVRLARDDDDLVRYYGFEALAGTLDGHAKYRHEHAHRPEIDYAFAVATAADRQELAMRVSIAAEWLRRCGPQLRRAILSGDCGGSSGGGSSGGAIGETMKTRRKGEEDGKDNDDGAGKAQWQFRKRRWEEMAQLEAIDDETRRAARPGFLPLLVSILPAPFYGAIRRPGHRGLPNRASPISGERTYAA